MNYSQQQIDEANQVSIADFLWRQGEQLEKCGREYRWKRHDSVTIRSNRWFQHSQSRGGYPIEFVETFYGMSFPEAVGALLECEGVIPMEPIPMQEPTFTLPPRADNNNELYRYLTKKRKIAPAVVDHFITTGNLYEDAVHHNVVFVGLHNDGTPRYASMRGTKEHFRLDVAGSDKACGFKHIGTNDKLFVFEAPIDLMSFASQYAPWQECSMVSLGGVSPKAMVQFLKDHPGIKAVYIALDNDDAGRTAALRLAELVPNRMKVAQLIPKAKDWNDLLTTSDVEKPLFTIGFMREPKSDNNSPMMDIADIPSLHYEDGRHCPLPDEEEYEALDRMEDDMMMNDIRITNAQMTEKPMTVLENNDIPVDMICLNDVMQIMVNWLWYPYLPLGKLTAILGNPGEGKTYTVMNIIAACTNCRMLPGMKQPMEPFNVIYQTAEDGLGDTVKPRLVEAGADLTRVFTIDDTTDLLTLTDDRVERAIRQNNVKLCVFDPIQAFLGANVDMNRANEVRPILARLGKVAERTGCAIVFIGHLNKATGMQSLQRGLGSIDIVAAMRSVLVIGKLKKDPAIRIMAHEKSSLAPNGTSLAFKLDEDDGFVWIGEYDVSADDLLSGAEGKKENKTDAAKALIRLLLDGGKSLPSNEIDRIALEKGIPARTVRDAKKAMATELSSWYGEGHVKMFKLAG